MLLDFVIGEYVVMFVLKNLKRKRKDMPVKVEERKFLIFINSSAKLVVKGIWAISNFILC